MKLWQFAVIAAAASVLAGCRADPNIVLLERENKLQDDEIHRLQRRIRDMEEGDCAEPAYVRPSRRTPATDVPYEQDSGPSAAESRPQTRPGRSSPAARPPAESFPQPPAEVIPRPKSLENETPPSINIENVPSLGPAGGNSPGGAAPSGTPGSSPHTRNQRMHEALPAGFSPGGSDSSRVMQITLNRNLCGGFSSNSRSGDEGLLVVIEPRDLRGQVLDAPADINVVLLDPAFQGDESRIARWDLTAAESADRFNRGTDPGIHLTLPWPATPPQHGMLKLFVRYTTKDGRKLQVEAPIRIAIGGERSAHWIPSRDAGRSWRESPAAPDADSPRTATRPDDARRPVWSPDRIY